MLLNLRLPFVLLTLASLTLAAAPPPDPYAAEARAKEKELINTLRTDPSKSAKGVACKLLAIYGTAEAVPALEPLLLDPELCSWARIAMEAIPGPQATKALLQAASKTQGRTKIGLINSLGFRRDPAAISGLAGCLKDKDAEVVGAAAVALGQTGGSRAASALKKALRSAPAAALPAVAEGALRCADGFRYSKESSPAAALYIAVTKSSAPERKKLEATRGLILARGDGGFELLLGLLNSKSDPEFAMGLRVARELPGVRVTRDLSAQMARFSPDRQPLLLLAIADRRDAAAMPVILASAQSGPEALRLVALGALEKTGGIAVLPALIAAASDANPAITQAAQAALVRLPGDDVDAALLAALKATPSPACNPLIRVAGLRGLAGAIPVLAAMMREPGTPEATRKLATQSLGQMGTVANLPPLAAALQTAPEGQREDLEAAMTAICSRAGAAAAQAVLPLLKSQEPAVRIIALHSLAAAGGPEALKAILGGLADADETVRDETVRTLATWPNTWPDDDQVTEPLMELLKTGQKTTYKVLAARAYTQWIRGHRQLSPEDKATRMNALFPQLPRAEEKSAAIAALGEIISPQSLTALAALGQDAAWTEDCCAALLKLAEKPRLSEPERKQAFEYILAKSADPATKRKAKARLASLNSK